MLRSQLIGSVQHVVISAKTTDWDRKFLDALALVKLDVSDKTLTTVSVNSEQTFLFQCLPSLTLCRRPL